MLVFLVLVLMLMLVLVLVLVNILGVSLQVLVLRPEIDTRVDSLVSGQWGHLAL